VHIRAGMDLPAKSRADEFDRFQRAATAQTRMAKVVGEHMMEQTEFTEKHVSGKFRYSFRPGNTEIIAVTARLPVESDIRITINGSAILNTRWRRGMHMLPAPRVLRHGSLEVITGTRCEIIATHIPLLREPAKTDALFLVESISEYDAARGSAVLHVPHRDLVRVEARAPGIKKLSLTMAPSISMGMTAPSLGRAFLIAEQEAENTGTICIVLHMPIRRSLAESLTLAWEFDGEPPETVQVTASSINFLADGTPRYSP
jgi:hypothetical protein